MLCLRIVTCSVIKYVGISNLDTTSYVITLQLKLLAAALFSVFVFRRRVSPLRWLSLLTLSIGVILVQLEPEHATASGSGNNRALGLVALITACLCSGFAGTYMEFALQSGSSTSLWMRNLQVGVRGFFSCP